MQNAPQNKAEGHEQEVELLDLPPGTPQPPGGGLDILRYLPILFAILEAVTAGRGSFVTNTPLGKKRITIEPA